MKKLFNNNIFYNIITWFAIIATIPYSISTLILYDDKFIMFTVVIRILVAILLAGLYFAFKKTNKNAMFSIIGAILTSYLLNALIYLVYYPEYFISTIIITLITILLFISSLFINSCMHTSSKMVALSQHMSILFAGFSLVTLFFWIPDCVNVIDTVVTIIEAIASPLCVLSIVCVETRIKAYYFEKSMRKN